MEELLFPRTDGGVAAQLAVVLTVAAAATYLVRRDRELVLFVVGLTVLAIGLIGLRALH